MYIYSTVEIEEKVAKSLTIVCNNKRYKIDTTYIFAFIILSFALELSN